MLYRAPALHAQYPHGLREEAGKVRCLRCQRCVGSGLPRRLQSIFVSSECLGTAAEKASATRSAARAEAACLEPLCAAGRPHRQHRLLRSGTVVWCRRCGCYAERVLRGLRDDCLGTPSPGGGRAAQLSELLKGRHPRTNAWLPAAVSVS